MATEQQLYEQNELEKKRLNLSQQQIEEAYNLSKKQKEFDQNRILERLIKFFDFESGCHFFLALVSKPDILDNFLVFAS